jgi:hypothetical protein
LGAAAAFLAGVLAAAGLVADFADFAVFTGLEVAADLLFGVFALAGIWGTF